MLKELDYKKKRLLMGVVILVILYLAYQFSFRHTLVAIRLNGELSQQQEGDGFSESSIIQIRRKSLFYKGVVKDYRIKKEDMDNRIWQSVSGMAVAKNVLISFDAAPLTIETDTSAVAKGLISKYFSLKGDYADLVGFLDTLSQSKGNGRLSMVKIFKPKENGVNQNGSALQLNITLIGK